MSAFMVPTVEFLNESEAQEYTDDTEARPGYYSRLSAPGYMDCTEWRGPYFTAEEALVELCELYDCDTEGNTFGDDDYDDTELSELRAKLLNGKRR